MCSIMGVFPFSFVKGWDVEDLRILKSSNYIKRQQKTKLVKSESVPWKTSVQSEAVSQEIRA